MPCARPSRVARQQAALDSLRLVAQNFPVLARPRFALVGVDDQIMRAFPDLLGMKDHFMPVTKPAPPRPRKPDLHSSTIHARPFRTKSFVPSQSPRLGTPQTRFAQSVEVGENSVLILQHQVPPPETGAAARPE